MFTPTATAPTIKLAIIRSTSIGDVVLATACIDLLKHMGIPFELYWVGRNPALGLISAAYPEVVPVELNSERASYIEDIVAVLRSVHFVLDLQMSIRSRGICRSLQRKANISTYTCNKNSLKRGQMVVAARLRGRRSSLAKEYQKSDRYQHAMMSDALKAALKVQLPLESYDLIKNYQARPSLPTDHDDKQRSWQKELKFGNWISIAPGASYDAKRAPHELLVASLKRLAVRCEEVGYNVRELGLLFVGSEEDRVRALTILDSLGWQGPTLNLAGKLTLWESALAIQETQVILSNDSSLCHIAEAVGRPSLVLFGPTVEAFGFAPWREDSRSFSSSLGCRPCSKHGKTDCRYGDKLCFKTLASSEIAEALLNRAIPLEAHD